MHSKEQNLTLRYACINAFYWMLFAAIIGFASVYLLDHGFSNYQTGIIIAISGLVSAFIQPVAAGYADSPKSPSLKIILIVFCTIIALIGFLSLIFKAQVLLFGFFVGCGITIVQIVLPLFNALGTESINQGKKLNFGFARGIGSIGYAVGAYILGFLVEGFGTISITFAIIITVIILIVFVLCFPFKKQKGVISECKKIRSENPLEFFRRYKRFSIVLVGCILIYLSHALINTYTYQIVVSKGGDSSQNGIAISIAAVSEIPVMVLFVGMLKKVGCHIWFRISGIFFMLKILATLLAPAITVYYAIQPLQMMGWGLMTVSSVYYVNLIMKPEDAIKGQAYMTMTYTIGCVIGALLGGRIIDASGVNDMLVFGTIAAIIGMLIMLFATQKTE